MFSARGPVISRSHQTDPCSPRRPPRPCQFWPMCYSPALDAMKLFSAFLSIVMFLHLQCGGSCLNGASGGPVQTSETSGEPSCHHHEEVPASNNQPSHDVNGPCTRGQFIESKLSNSGKVILQITSLLPVEMNPVPMVDSAFRLFTPES